LDMKKESAFFTRTGKHASGFKRGGIAEGAGEKRDNDARSQVVNIVSSRTVIAAPSLSEPDPKKESGVRVETRDLHLRKTSKTYFRARGNRLID